MKPTRRSPEPDQLRLCWLPDIKLEVTDPGLLASHSHLLDLRSGATFGAEKLFPRTARMISIARFLLACVSAQADASSVLMPHSRNVKQVIKMKSG